MERTAWLHEQSFVAEKEAFIAELQELNGKQEGQIGQYRHAKFGPKSEKRDPAQLELSLEDLETAIAETQERIATVEARPSLSIRIVYASDQCLRRPTKVQAQNSTPSRPETIVPVRPPLPAYCGDQPTRTTGSCVFDKLIL